MALLNVRRLLSSTAGCCLQHQAPFSPCMVQWLGCVHVVAARFHAGGHRNLATQPGPAGLFTVMLMSTSSVSNWWSMLIDWPGGALQHANSTLGAGWNFHPAWHSTTCWRTGLHQHQQPLNRSSQHPACLPA